MTGAALLDQLAARVRAMEGPTLPRETLPVLPALADVVPGGPVRGGVYEIASSLSLASAFLAGPSSAGGWCAVVGVPELGAEAAASLGVDLERVILVPSPGEHWVHVVTTLADVTEAILLRTPARVSDGEAQRVAARLRRERATLFTLTRTGVGSAGSGPAGSVGSGWPRPHGRLEVVESAWSGIEEGRGHLRTRRLRVVARGRWGRPHETELWWESGTVATEAPAGAAPSRPGPLRTGSSRPGQPGPGERSLRQVAS